MERERRENLTDSPVRLITHSMSPINALRHPCRSQAASWEGGGERERAKRERNREEETEREREGEKERGRERERRA